MTRRSKSFGTIILWKGCRGRARKILQGRGGCFFGLKEQKANVCFLRESYRTLIKTQDYLDVFARFKQKENIEAVERMLTSKTELELFERSQLGMLISHCILDGEKGGVLGG